MNRIFRLPGAVKRDPAISAWLRRRCSRTAARRPPACVGDAAFAYVNAFKAHVNVGFFGVARLSGPAGLLEGSGKYMRHVKLRPGDGVDASALIRLIESAYTGVKNR